MNEVPDVIAYLRKGLPGLAGKKLQKLLFYADVWAQVWDDEPLFAKEFEAWVDGPVLREAFALEKRKRRITGDASALRADQRATLDAVIDFYGRRSGHWLSELTHREQPWRKARRGLGRRSISKAPVRRADIAKYYGATLYGRGKSFSSEYERGLQLLVELPEDEVELLFAAPMKNSLQILRQMDSGEET